MIFADFESILAPEDNGKQNLDQSCTSRHQKHVACSDGHKSVCVDDIFRKPFKSYLDQDSVDNFINSFFEESKYCSDTSLQYLLSTKNTF